MTEITTLHSHESLPKRIRSASARIFSLNSDSFNPKRSTCHIQPTTTMKWLPRIRTRSASSASSTFSVVFSSSPHASYIEPNHHHGSHFDPSVSLDVVSSELEDLYRTAKEEIADAIESQGSIYYEGDQLAAQLAFENCKAKYDDAMQLFGDTANAVKFRFRWESDLYHLQLTLKTLPAPTLSIYD
ncbi:hypothetical protein INT47_006929 [Mucor saturninus]|uniref:Uncharacterized protein n=1 Tax=Mucor saturninus TaxID=64648 RepID=A0A8H7QQL0_9FUNG|nr:hypothetical protein INT47_006929 [Mucor saturninus]